MFDYVRNNKKFIQIILAVIMVPFALFGIDAYQKSGSVDGVATVAGNPIFVGEFQAALREQQERLRPQLGGANPELLEGSEIRKAVLQELINQRLLHSFAIEGKMRVSDEMLAGYITSVPSLQENGKFSRDRYQALVAAQGMSIDTFEVRVRQDLLLQQAMMAAGNGTFAGKTATERWLMAQLDQREIREAPIPVDQLTAKGKKPDEAAIRQYYEANRRLFERPEQVRVEYLVLQQDKLVAASTVTDTEIENWYRANQGRYTQAEQRQASHVLIRVDKNASEEEVRVASDKVQSLYTQLQTNPGEFAQLAKQYSQDPGSAKQGGGLGYFGRGMMVKPFEDAVYGLAMNQISPVVRSDFGFHIIKLTGIKPEQVRSLAEVRGEIAKELQRQQAVKRYAEAAESFANLVYEQPDSLKPAAEKFGLMVETTEWMARNGQLVAPFTNPKLIQAIFSDDAVKNRRNTEAIDVGNNTLVSVRVLEHRAAEVEPLAAVSAVIEKTLLHEAALAQAQVTGEELRDRLAKGEKVQIEWGKARTVLRMHSPNMSNEARDQIFSAPTDSLPAYVGAKTSSGFVVYRIDVAKHFDPATDAAGEAAGRVSALRQQYAQTVAQEDILSWMATLRERFLVRINADVFDKK